MKFKTILAAAVAAATLAPAPGFAQQPVVVPAEPTEEEIAKAVNLLNILVGAFQSQEVPQEAKNALFGCLFENNLRRVSAETTRVLGANPQLDAANPSHVLTAAAGVCGFRADAEGAPADQPEGR